MSIDEQPMNVYWSGKRTETSNNFKTNYKGSVATKNNLPSLGNKTGDMYNVTESGENFVWNGNSWDSLSGDALKALNWQKSEKVSAVVVYPVPEIALEPVVDFLFKESGPASGDKGPENPSAIAGVSAINVTRCGKNLFKTPYLTASGSTVQTTTFVVDDDSGAITVNTSTISSKNAQFWLEGNTSTIRLVAGKTYYLSGCPSGGSSSTYYLALTLYTLSHEWLGPSFYDYGSGCAITPSVDCYFVAAVTVKAGTTVSNLVFKPQLELGSTVTVFEPYSGTDYTVNLGNTYYGGEIDLATGVMTVTWVGLVLDGTEAWSASQTHGTYYRYLLIVTPNKNTTDIACTHFVRVNNLDYEVQHYIIASGALNIFASQTTVEDFKAWLASQYANGTPVVVCYALATPQTVQLTPTEILSLTQTDKYTPRLNTIYTDASAVQVGYVKSPIRSEYELTQAIIATEGGE